MSRTLNIVGFIISFLAAGSAAAGVANSEHPRHGGLEYPLTVALLTLAVVHAFLIFAARGSSTATRDPEGQPGESPARTTVGLTLLAVGLWTFVVLSVGGLGAVYVADTPLLAVTALNIRVVATAAFVALYAMAVLWVRHRWILQPSAQLAVGSTLFPGGPKETDPPVSLFSDGYFLHEYQVSKSNRINAIRNAADDSEELRLEAVRSFVEAEGIGSLKTSQDALKGMLFGSQRMDSELVRHHALVIAMAAPDLRTCTVIYIGKVQNQLFVFTFLLLAAAAVFGVLGWGLPMAFGAAAAIVFRIRDLTPLGDKKSFDGGARWMALFSTPLTGAVSAVLGLMILGALAEMEILGTAVSGAITSMEVPLSDPLAFKPISLAFAIAFGWSAKLLDSMLGKLTHAVEGKTKGGEDDGNGNGDEKGDTNGQGDETTGGSAPETTDVEIVQVSQAVTKSHPKVTITGIRKNPDDTFNVDGKIRNTDVKLSISDDYSAVTVLKS